jgi:hypothetical protein
MNKYLKEELEDGFIGCLLGITIMLIILIVLHLNGII